MANKIKDGRAHRTCSVKPRFVNGKGRPTQRPNLDEKISKKPDIEGMTGTQTTIIITINTITTTSLAHHHHTCAKE